MPDETLADASRRWLLSRLSALPLLSLTPPLARAFEAAASAGDVLNVMEFDALAKAALPPAHFAYIATGADDDRTVAWNHEAFSKLQIHARRFVDVSRVDQSVNIFGVTYPSPVYLSAVSSQRAFNPEGEVATARAAASRKVGMMLSTGTSASLEAVSRARGTPPWMQLYVTDDWNVTKGLVARSEGAGCPAIVLTIDYLEGRNNETLIRGMREDKRVCSACHADPTHDPAKRSPMYAGLDISKVTELMPSKTSWEYLDRFRALVKVKLIVKGIVSGEDAKECVRRGVDGIVVSNHGGRDEETLRATIDCLPEVASAVGGRIPVMLDGGVRRGTDVFKALALGATAVGIGRPQVWGLAAFGQPGVEAVLDIYQRELLAIMRQAGTPSVASITRNKVSARS